MRLSVKFFYGYFTKIFTYIRRLNSIALEERRNVINEKLAKKDRKKKKKKKEKKEKCSRETTGSDSNSTGPSNYCSDMAENESA